MNSKNKDSSAHNALDDGNPPHKDAGIFGSMIKAEDASLVVIPVPWEATTSYGRGTAQGPEAVLKASHQLDLYDPVLGEPYRSGIHLLPADPVVVETNLKASDAAQRVISSFENGLNPLPQDLKVVNEASQAVNHAIRQTADYWRGQGKICAVLGGDHSSPFGLLKSLSASGDTFDILHIDAHHDLRKAYEGFEHSHASIMYNVLEQIPEVTRLVQVGIRDYSKHEKIYAQESPKITTHYDQEIFRQKAQGVPWAQLVRQIIEPLGPRVYVSFDIDGLDPSLCPHTGTPVPGGLSFQEAMYLVEALVLGGKKVIGFDLCEVAPGPSDWDANVGARVLYKLCGAALYEGKR